MKSLLEDVRRGKADTPPAICPVIIIGSIPTKVEYEGLNKVNLDNWNKDIYCTLVLSGGDRFGIADSVARLSHEEEYSELYESHAYSYFRNNAAEALRKKRPAKKEKDMCMNIASKMMKILNIESNAKAAASENSRGILSPAEYRQVPE